VKKPVVSKKLDEDDNHSEDDVDQHREDRSESPDPLELLTPDRRKVYDIVSKAHTPNTARGVLNTLLKIPPRPRPTPPLASRAEEEVSLLYRRNLAARLEDDVEVLDIEMLSDESNSPTPGGRRRREKFRIMDISDADKARWQRLIEAVILDYIRIGPEAIISSGDGQRQNLDHRQLRRLINDRHIQFFPSLVSKLDEHQMNMVLCHFGSGNNG
jgi:hypothetical protein